jgi:hypothetical protein
VGRALLRAYQLGCRFDGWAEMFNYDLWMRAFNETGVDPHFYNRDVALNEVLPWDFIDIGVSKKFLLKERERSYEKVQTYDCKWGDCRGCGIPGNYADIKLAAIPSAPSVPDGASWDEADHPPLDKGGPQWRMEENGLPLTLSLCEEGKFAGKADDEKLVQLTLPAQLTSPGAQSPVISGARAGKPVDSIPPKPSVALFEGRSCPVSLSAVS